MLCGVSARSIGASGHEVDIPGAVCRGVDGADCRSGQSRTCLETRAIERRSPRARRDYDQRLSGSLSRALAGNQSTTSGWHIHAERRSAEVHRQIRRRRTTSRPKSEHSPNVMDRLIQQAVLQVLTPIFDPGFSESSFGFRPQRSAQDAAKRVQKHIRAGYRHCIEAGGQSSEKPRLPHRRGRPERPEHGSAFSSWDGAVRFESVRRTNANSGTARRR